MANQIIRFTLEERNFVDFYKNDETQFKVGDQIYIIQLGSITTDEASNILCDGPEEDEEEEEDETETGSNS